MWPWGSLLAARWVWPWKAKKEKFHTCGGPRRRPCLGQGRGRRICQSHQVKVLVSDVMFLFQRRSSRRKTLLKMERLPSLTPSPRTLNSPMKFLMTMQLQRMRRVMTTFSQMTVPVASLVSFLRFWPSPPRSWQGSPWDVNSLQPGQSHRPAESLLPKASKRGSAIAIARFVERKDIGKETTNAEWAKDPQGHPPIARHRVKSPLRSQPWVMADNSNNQSRAMLSTTKMALLKFKIKVNSLGTFSNAWSRLQFMRSRMVAPKVLQGWWSATVHANEPVADRPGLRLTAKSCSKTTRCAHIGSNVLRCFNLEKGPQVKCMKEFTYQVRLLEFQCWLGQQFYKKIFHSLLPIHLCSTWVQPSACPPTWFIWAHWSFNNTSSRSWTFGDWYFGFFSWKRSKSSLARVFTSTVLERPTSRMCPPRVFAFSSALWRADSEQVATRCNSNLHDGLQRGDDWWSPSWPSARTSWSTLWKPPTWASSRTSGSIQWFPRSCRRTQTDAATTASKGQGIDTAGMPSASNACGASGGIRKPVSGSSIHCRSHRGPHHCLLPHPATPDLLWRCPRPRPWQLAKGDPKDLWAELQLLWPLHQLTHWSRPSSTTWTRTWTSTWTPTQRRTCRWLRRFTTPAPSIYQRIATSWRRLSDKAKKQPAGSNFRRKRSTTRATIGRRQKAERQCPHQHQGARSWGQPLWILDDSFSTASSVHRHPRALRWKFKADAHGQRVWT